MKAFKYVEYRCAECGCMLEQTSQRNHDIGVLEYTLRHGTYDWSMCSQQGTYTFWIPEVIEL